jgi:hypothetical protein
VIIDTPSSTRPTGIAIRKTRRMAAETQLKREDGDTLDNSNGTTPEVDRGPPARSSPSTTNGKSKHRDKDPSGSAKRRCVSTACIACRRRKSKVSVGTKHDRVRPIRDGSHSS